MAEEWEINELRSQIHDLIIESYGRNPQSENLAYRITCLMRELLEKQRY